MKATWYEKQGAARDVLIVGEMYEPQPLTGEVRIRVAASGINLGDVKKRQDAFGYGMPYPRNGIELRKPHAARSSEFIRSVWLLESQQINLLLRAPLNSMPLPYPRIIPHSDGAGTVDAVGERLRTPPMTKRGFSFA